MPALSVSFKKHALGMFVVFCLVASAVAAIILLRPPVFEARARINIPEKKISETSKQQSEENTPQQQGVTLQTATEILQGNVLAEQVLNSIGFKVLFPDLAQQAVNQEEFRTQALATFQQNLSITPIQGSRIIHISFQHSQADLSARVIETILQLFQKKFEELQPVQLLMPSKELPIYRQEMFQAENILSIFQQRNQMLVSGEEQEKIRTLHAQTQESFSAEQEQLQALSQQLKASEKHFASLLKPAEQKREDDFTQERQDIIRLRIYEQDLKEKYGKESTGNRLIKNVRLQVTSLKKELYTEAGLSASEQEAAVKAEDQLVLTKLAYRKQQKKTDALQRQLHQTESKIQDITEQEKQLTAMRQQAESARKRYTELVQEFDAEQEARRLASQIQVLEKPVIPLAPIKPKKTSALILGLIFGLVGSLLYGGIQLLRAGKTEKEDRATS